MKKLAVKIADSDIEKELNDVNFESSYINIYASKYRGKAYKILNLKTPAANILKQLCLSLGFDCAVSRGTVTCSDEYTSAIIFASNYQLEKLCVKLECQPFGLKELSFLFKDILSSKLESLILNKTVFDWSKPYIMGILNVTPDSFSDGGKYFDIKSALNHVIQMVNDGADIIDIGGESTRPGADILDVNEEINRVIPVINQIKKQGIQIPISVDTRNYETAKQAIDAGADVINDVSGLSYDNKLFKYVTEKNIPVIIMHSDKVPAVSDNFTSEDIVEQVYFALNDKIKSLISAGLDKNKIIADVGIGFGKSVDACLELLKRHNEFKSLAVPMLLGISRKSFIRNTFEICADNSDVPTALYSSLVKNVNIHRVHNVKLTKEYLDFAQKLR